MAVYRIDWRYSEEEDAWGYVATDLTKDHNEVIGWAVGRDVLDALIRALIGRGAERIVLAPDVPERDKMPQRFITVPVELEESVA